MGRDYIARNIAAVADPRVLRPRVDVEEVEEVLEEDIGGDLASEDRSTDQGPYGREGAHHA